MSLGGWVKVHRALSDHHISSDPATLSVWLHLLLLANHKETKRMINGRVIAIQPGQLITSRKSLSAKTGVNESKVERVLNTLKSEQQIEQHGTSKFRVISIVKWAEYQSDEQQSEQLVNSKRTADEQQMNTPEEVSSDTKNEKNVKKTPSPASGDANAEKAARKSRLPEPFLVTKEMREWAVESAPAVTMKTETENFCDYWRGAGGTKLDWVATWRTWMRKAQKDSQGSGRGGYKVVNQQQVVEDNNARVVREIQEREQKTANGQDQSAFDLGEPITIEGEFIHAT